MTFQVRQGDVFIEQVPAQTPAGVLACELGPVILAFGEVTGHAHRVVALGALGALEAPDRCSYGSPAAQLFNEPDGRRLLFVTRPCAVTHEEHGPIALQPGVYRVTLQREYEPDGPTLVRD